MSRDSYEACGIHKLHDMAVQAASKRLLLPLLAYNAELKDVLRTSEPHCAFNMAESRPFSHVQKIVKHGPPVSWNKSKRYLAPLGPDTLADVGFRGVRNFIIWGRQPEIHVGCHDMSGNPCIIQFSPMTSTVALWRVRLQNLETKEDHHDEIPHERHTCAF